MKNIAPHIIIITLLIMLFITCDHNQDLTRALDVQQKELKLKYESKFDSLASEYTELMFENDRIKRSARVKLKKAKYHEERSKKIMENIAKQYYDVKHLDSFKRSVKFTRRDYTDLLLSPE